jgi:hypothetical protein
VCGAFSQQISKLTKGLLDIHRIISTPISQSSIILIISTFEAVFASHRISSGSGEHLL